MGLFDRFRKKQEETIEVKKSPEKISIDGLVDKLEASLNLEDLQEKSKVFYESITASFLELGKLNEKLKEAEFESGDKTYASANMVKDAFVKKTRSIINSLGFPKTLGQSGNVYTFVASFHSSVMKSIKEIQSLTPKQAILMSNYFRQEAAPVMAKIRGTDAKIKELGEFLNSEGKKIQLMDELKLAVDNYHHLMKNIDSLKQNKIAISEKIRDTEKSNVETEISQLKQTPRWIEFETLEKELKANQEKVSDIEFNIKEQLSVIAKPLKKVDYLISRGLVDFSSRGHLSDFLSAPFESFTKDQGDNSLKKLIEELNGIIDTKKISLKAREAQKIKELSKALANQLNELRDIYIDTKNKNLERASKIKQYADMLEKKQELEKRLADEREQLFSSKNQIKLIEKNILETEERISKLKEETENKVFETTGDRIELTFN